MSHQPLDLSTLLTISARGRGAGRGASTGHAPPLPRRTRGASTRSSSSPGERDSSVDAADAQREKRPRNEDAIAPNTQSSEMILESLPVGGQAVHEAWTPRLVRGDRPVNIGDSASSSETALALAQGLLLPTDMQKEASSSSDRLVSTGLVNGIKFIQKMVTLGQKVQEVEGERNKLLNDNTRLLRTISRLEKERDKSKRETVEAKTKLATAEESLNQALSEIDSTKKAAYEDGYQKGFDATTASYVDQMPTIQDKIWAACWEACLIKVGVAEDSPLWVENELPSSRASVSQMHEEPLLEDVEQQIDEFAAADEDIQTENQDAVAGGDGPIGIASGDAPNETVVADTAEAAINVNPVIQDLD